MPPLKKPISIETTFGMYVLHELLGEGGAGRVYAGTGIDDSPIAVKILTPERVSTDKRRRFQNEIAFLSRNKHPNIVNVLDHGITREGQIVVPFYVMHRYDGSLRDVMAQGIPPERVLPLFSQILDGVEAAHFKGVVHRDLKPENVLHDRKSNQLAVADFGTARFTEDLVATVQTEPGQRLANFQYAAPEQRMPGRPITATADIYALGLILNELFTGAVPHGTEYRLISQVSTNQSFLDAIVARMLRQSPEERPKSISEVKGLIQKYESEAISLQKVSEMDGRVIKATEIDEPLAHTPPKLVGFDWDQGTLTLILDRKVTPLWIDALHHMGSYGSVMGKPPQVFSFNGNKVAVTAAEHEVQLVIDNFKAWLPIATHTLNAMLDETAKRDEAARKEQLRRERQAEEQRLRIMRNARI